MNSDDIKIDFFNGISSSVHVNWETRKALHDSEQAEFTFGFRFSRFESLTLYDLQFRRYG